MLPPLDTIVLENYSLFNPRVQFTLERNAYRFTGHKQDAILRLTPPGGREDGFVLLTEGVRIDGKSVSRSEALKEILSPFQTSTSIKPNAQVSRSPFIDCSSIDGVKVEEKEASISTYNYYPLMLNTFFSLTRNRAVGFPDRCSRVDSRVSFAFVIPCI